MDKAIEQELKRLEKLTDLQLLQLLERLEDEPAPKWVKDLIVEKVRSILNEQIGIA